jgi:2-polyprenyl-3-methyl-5-hydroxy-6-metoxy-1,4-benzoquinol methylase
MASSFSSQIATIVGLIQMLRPAPRRVLDIGKGFGKYGFLAHEYIGIDSKKRPDPSKTLAEQSAIAIDAIESNRDYLWPHVSQIYENVFVGRIEELYANLHGYDLILMLDVIEHIDKKVGSDVLTHFLRDGATLVVSTPNVFFNQDLYESPDERHVSFWTPSDFRSLGAFVDYQNAGPGRVFLLSSQRLDVRGFGRKPIKRLRRLVRQIQSELFV